MKEQHISKWAEQLNKLSLKEFPELFSSSTVPDITDITGYFRASFVGPGWLRATAGPATAIGGLGGWWGKKLEEDGRATNLVRHGDKLESRLAMRLITTTSVLDGKPVLAL